MPFFSLKAPPFFHLVTLLRNDICQGYAREMLGGVLCLLMLIFVRKLEKACLFYLSDTYV